MLSSSLLENPPSKISSTKAPVQVLFEIISAAGKAIPYVDCFDLFMKQYQPPQEERMLFRQLSAIQQQETKRMSLINNEETLNEIDDKIRFSNTLTELQELGLITSNQGKGTHIYRTAQSWT